MFQPLHISALFFSYFEVEKNEWEIFSPENLNLHRLQERRRLRNIFVIAIESYRQSLVHKKNNLYGELDRIFFSLCDI